MQVYEPAEDSFLLLDALELELEGLKLQPPTLAVEVGGGSGLISTALALQLPSSYWFVTDLNPVACNAILRTAAKNGASLEVIRTSILSSLSSRMFHQVDLLICNPPYVATDDEELGGTDISAAWAGGSRGLNVTQALIEILDDILSPTGVAYIVVEQCNNPDQVIEDIKLKNFNCDVILERRAGREFLKILKISRK